MKTKLLLCLLLLSVCASAQTYTYSTLIAFPKASKKGADWPLGLSIDSNGNLYGLAGEGGSKGFGSVWKVTPHGVLSVLYDFTSAWGSDGGSPNGDPFQTVVLSGSYAYGFTSNLGIWKLNTTTKKLTVLSTATLGNGDLAIDSGGNLYGYVGGSDNNEGVFKLTPKGVYSVLYSGIGGWDRPIIDMAGNLYGATFGGGEYSVGSVWELSSGGVYTVLYSFDGTPGGESPDGAWPEARLSQDPEGNLYGTTFMGGEEEQGIVYEISSGVETILTDFNPADGWPFTAYPQGPVIRDSAGNLFGTVPAFFGPGEGGVWEIPVGGQATEIAYAENFIGEVIVMDKSGNIYGTTNYGGSGTVFKLTKN